MLTKLAFSSFKAAVLRCFCVIIGASCLLIRSASPKQVTIFVCSNGGGTNSIHNQARMHQIRSHLEPQIAAATSKHKHGRLRGDAKTHHQDGGRQIEDDKLRIYSSYFSADEEANQRCSMFIPLLLDESPTHADIAANSDWVIFLQQETRLNLAHLLRFLESFDSRRAHFLGRAIRDDSPTIIHHFEFESETPLYYPLVQSGFAISQPVIAKLRAKFADFPDEMDFHIDPAFELAKFLRDHLAVQLTHQPEFCAAKQMMTQSHEVPPLCVSFIAHDSPGCPAQPIPDDQLFVAIKTARKFFDSRIPILKASWTGNLRNIIYFADESDAFIPAVSVGVPNTESGHCEKFLRIILHLSRAFNASASPPQFVLIADDDSLINMEQLKRVLACYQFDASGHLALGERYYYGSWRFSQHSGYDYITGGGGTVLSVPLLHRLAAAAKHKHSSGTANQKADENDQLEEEIKDGEASPPPLVRCNSAEDPDDMSLGIWLDALQQPITHSPLFHQARRVDYAAGFLAGALESAAPVAQLGHVSFHKFEEIDPLHEFRTQFRSVAEPPLQQTEQPPHEIAAFDKIEL